MFVDDGGGAASTAEVQSISASMNNFAQTAASGGFAVSETGGQALIATIDRLLDWIDSKGADLYTLRQRPQLGGSGGAKSVSPFAQKVATDSQGFLTVLQELQQSLVTAKQGITTAMGNYKEHDSSNAGTFQQV